MPTEAQPRIDPIPYWKVMLRAMHPFRVLRIRALQGPFTDDGFVEAATAVHRDSAASGTIGGRRVALWKLERIGFSYCRQGAGTLRWSSIPIEIQPIAHTGLGFAAVEEAALRPEKVRESIDRRAHPGFRHFAYESVGCAWGVLDHRGFRKLFEAFTGIRFARCPPSDPGEFVARFPPESHRLLSHGYGRTLYFVHGSLAKSFRSVQAGVWLDGGAAVQGVAFAYAMLNVADLGRVLDLQPDFEQPALREAFATGLEFALAMLSWTFPGTLEGLSYDSKRQRELIDRAKRLVSRGRAAGYFNSPGFSALSPAEPGVGLISRQALGAGMRVTAGLSKNARR